ncbi:MAG: SMC-Scp complex subunit ScpB [Gemmataceae bacterium]
MTDPWQPDDDKSPREPLAAEALRHMPSWQVDVGDGVALPGEEPAPLPPEEEIGEVEPEPAPPAAEAEPAPDDVPPPPSRIIEAMLFIGGPPLTAARATEAIRGLTEEQFLETIQQLNHDYRRQGRPYIIQGRQQGYVITLRPRYRAVVERLRGGVRQARLSLAAIDVLALVAYRQPVTKAEIDTIRGLESGAVLRLLVRHGLAAVVPRVEGAKRETAYVTTPRFLELFGLRSLDDLPQTEDLQKL